MELKKKTRQQDKREPEAKQIRKMSDVKGE